MWVGERISAFQTPPTQPDLCPFFIYCNNVNNQPNDDANRGTNVRVLAVYNRTITSKIRLFSVFCRKNRTYVISLVFVKKVLTKHDSVCYNNQAVREPGRKTG